LQPWNQAIPAADQLPGQASKSGECLDFFGNSEKKMPWACCFFVYLALIMGSPMALAASPTVV
jgi:hypothetical protein